MRTVIILLLLFCLTFSRAQTINQVILDDKGMEKLIGVYNKEAFTKASFRDWYNKYHDSYLANNHVVKH